MRKYLIVLVVIVLAIIISVTYLKLNKSTVPIPKACTEEAKICPDGSSVSRQGPDCEFEECPFTPDVVDETVNWKTYKNEKYGFEVKYPIDWKINDQSYTYSGAINTSLEIISPTIYDVPNYENTGAIFSLQINFKDNKVVVDHSRFVKVREQGDQAVAFINIADSVLQNYNEYKIAQQIIQSVKIIK